MAPEERQCIECPGCGQATSVRRKLLTVPWRTYPIGPASKHMSIRKPRQVRRTCISADFIHGYYCDGCGHGFVTDEVLREVGLNEQELLSRRCW